MATKKDCERALKFVVGQNIAGRIPWPKGENAGNFFGLNAYGIIEKIIRAPNLQTRDSGEFQVKWTDSGSSTAQDRGYWPDTIMAGNKLRFPT